MNPFFHALCANGELASSLNYIEERFAQES
jgi:hypothetical protein